MRKNFNAKDIIGRKIGKLLVVELDHYDKIAQKYYYKCKCDCGNECIVFRNYLLTSHVKSCGCNLTKNQKAFVDSRKKEKVLCEHCGKHYTYAKGLCRNCYNRFLRNGSPEYIVGETKKSIREKKTKERREKRYNYLKSLKPKSKLGKELLSRILNGESVMNLSKEYHISRQTIYDNIYKEN